MINFSKIKTMNKIINKLIAISFSLFLSGCGDLMKSAPPPPPKAENFLTLADVNGRVSLKEDSPE